MLVIPAIDIRKGKAVRLYQGKRDKEKVYSLDSYSVAKRWKEEGASILHIVDLDAAFGEGDNLDLIGKIIELGVDIQLGGGLRSLKKIDYVISMGVKRVIIGSKATEPDFLKEAVNIFKDKIAVGVDVLDDKVMILGWDKRSQFSLRDYILYLKDEGVKWIVYTDISRDGTLVGIEASGLKDLRVMEGLNVIFSGGISSHDDLKIIKERIPFIRGVIIGKALYEGLIDLREAIKLLK
ncbi:MAG: 1-(5-phosphoribosyl)-5-[(5-phosphoribosylamino)methylideneamino]imidazole-4-carboxamide isomerase [Candidatus Omnitrophica bacterium]|nr:1-(5-phosphoribosyl)-5-[(5-phosphoribosylamino)methylideneamino]imidazole-4-carboxamide isomerase [Candidatus Omnitrophota bacterium]